ncbi:MULTISPECIES: LPS export ABC transporter periplasmic protein LptC [Halomonadaceae]|uniref:LPS export ABC transporter periplasmic protein LptC n=1 Tax=Halomonadaceae TaxID=28256 RepID=UPI00159A3C58|nr:MULTISPECIES: LPS export ABC transporter periplasmic protein LptC [Halomonas]QJQ96439.1 LPS export ABC transporter periplasmic protein LptC [Halomonas sp. PA5]
MPLRPRFPRPSSKLWLVLVLLIVGGILALLDQRDTFGPGPVPRDDAGEPDYYLENATLTRFDERGAPHQRLDSPRLSHTPHDDVTRAQTPVARIFDRQGRTWFGYGDVGILGPGGDLLTLEGNARLNAPEEGWQLDTDILHVDTVNGHAWSDTPALLQQPPQWMRGERFDAWLNLDRARLTDEVQGFHPPEGYEEPAP